MTTSLLITQCLQNDFVEPIGRRQPIPNLLHVGYSESLRLMGEDPKNGPVARAMDWAYSEPDSRLRLIHIRDWHNERDPQQRAHLSKFGMHCIRDTIGADFAFQPAGGDGKDIPLIETVVLNDFANTDLESTLQQYAGQPCRVGIVGVWTEAKVSFLAYELSTRYPQFQIAVCSALCASSSRHHHFEALERLQRIMGVEIHDSVGDFIEFLGGRDPVEPLVESGQQFPLIETIDLSLGETDEQLVRFMFRDCKQVWLRALDGGFSGNVVAGTRSIDSRGHEQAPHVLKIGPRKLMGQERTSFERIQNVLGNNAPQISDFADYLDRGAIKYRYASMGGKGATTLQKRYASDAPIEEIIRILDVVFGEQLMRLYQAASREDCDLLDHYGFDSKWSDGVRRKVEHIIGGPAEQDQIELLPGVSVTNICRFYEQTLDQLPRRAGDQCFQAVVHGDLNGANIILDGHNNVWLIDFFHTRRAHVLMDLIKLENDLLYIFTTLEDESDLTQALRLTDALMQVEDIGTPLPESPGFSGAQFERAWSVIARLRSFYPQLIQTDRDPLQLWIGQLRYAVHTLGFEEATELHKKWALYMAAACVDQVSKALDQSTRLRLDWIDEQWTAPGRLALTLLPGRKDYGRNLEQDLEVLLEEGVSRVLCLVPQGELEHFGVGKLIEAMQQRGLSVFHLSIVDQTASSVSDMQQALAWVGAGLEAGESIMMHCVGGLGRTGMAAGSLLRSRGASVEQAISEVRRVRSSRAIETAVQEQFVRDFPTET